MRTFDQLSHAEKHMAVHNTRSILMIHILEGVVEVEMPNSILQRDFDRILSDAHKNEIGTELAKKMLLKHVAIGRQINKLVMAIAEGSVYDNNGWRIQNGENHD